MPLAKLILIIIGLALLFIAGFGGVASAPKIRFEWLGFAFIGCGLYLPI